ncbi:transposase, partial [Klebsiella pneumoniae]|uniref:transposase n=1 Tax=Klebsiella pneumoniae TaxID=573 RepID=UPI00287BA4BA
MSHQLTFADSEFSTKRRQTRKEIFLSRMEQILPWQNMVEVIEPFYPKAGNGRRPYPLETMLRIHCMQHWYNLSDGAMEDALYEIASMRLFARLSLDSALPDRTTIMNFRHLLEQHQLARQLFKTINRWLAEAGSDPKRDFPLPHGADSAMAKHGGSHRAVLSQGGQWP